MRISPSASALGIDTMGMAPGAETSFRANRLLLAEHRIHLENLAGLSEMQTAGGWIIIGESGPWPAPLRRCSG
jgi:kynurenine formamidase